MSGERWFNSGDPRDFGLGGPGGTGLSAQPEHQPERRPWWAYAIAGLVLTCALALMVAGTAAAVWAVFG